MFYINPQLNEESAWNLGFIPDTASSSIDDCVITARLHLRVLCTTHYPLTRSECWRSFLMFHDSNDSAQYVMMLSSVFYGVCSLVNPWWLQQ